LPYPVVALGLGGPCAKYLGEPFAMWITKKFSGPFHTKMLWQRYISCASV